MSLHNALKTRNASFMNRSSTVSISCVISGFSSCCSPASKLQQIKNGLYKILMTLTKSQQFGEKLPSAVQAAVLLLPPGEEER